MFHVKRLAAAFPLLAMMRVKRGNNEDRLDTGRAETREIWGMGREVWLMPGGCPLRLPRAIEQGGTRVLGVVDIARSEVLEY